MTSLPSAQDFFLKNSHVKDALDADQYPEIKFLSTTITKNANDYNAKGALTMHGVTLPVNVKFTFYNKSGNGVFNGSFTLMPKDFKITHDGTPDKVTISLSVPVTQ